MAGPRDPEELRGERLRVVALIAMFAKYRWLFVGCCDSYGCTEPEGSKLYVYEMTALSRRVIVAAREAGRQRAIAENDG